MSKLLEFTVPGTNRTVWISPEHVVSIAWAGDNRTSVKTVKDDYAVEGRVEVVAAVLNSER